MTEAMERGQGAVAGLLSDEQVDALLAGARGEDGQVRLSGPEGLLGQLVKRVLERGLAAELEDHLGYAKGEPAGRNGANSRNGTSAKTVATEIGPVRLQVPRDRDGSFEPQLVAKGQRRLDGLSGEIISLYAGGMTVRDIQFHLARTKDIDLSHETVSTVTEAMADEIAQWQERPLDEVYPIVYFDAIMVKVRDGAQVRTKAAHIAVGVDTDGVKHVLGIWIQTAEGAKFWAQVFAQLRARGLRDIWIACADGLSGLAAEIEQAWPQAMVQTCVVHLIRRSMRYASYGDRRAMAALLKPVYTAPSVEAAETALLEFAESDLGGKYPAAVRTWENAWEYFIPFLQFPPGIRRIIYTTNAIESLNYQLRKIIKNRGHFPSDTAVVKLLWLAIVNIEDKRALERAKEAGKKRRQRKAPGRLIEGHRTQGWAEAFNELTEWFTDRLPQAAI